MAIFNSMFITNKGQILYAKAQAGIQLHFTKMMVGSGAIGTQNPATLTGLVDPKYDVGIQSISPNTELKTATISGMINNSNVSEATYVCEIGLFATDPDEGEILYAYGSAGNFGDYMAPATVGAYSWNYQINAAIGNASNVTVELSNLVYDYGVINTNVGLTILTGGNQKEINKSIDNSLKSISANTMPYIATTGIANTYIATLTPALTAYKDGYGICVKINTDSTGASTLNINGLGAKTIKKPNGNNAFNLKSGSIYTLRYNGTNFILQGEGASGNAIASDLLLGKTASTDADDIIGTIPSKSAQTYTPGTINQTIAAGQYISEIQTILGDANLLKENIVAGKSLFGIDGSATIESLGGYKIIRGTAIPYYTSVGEYSNTVYHFYIDAPELATYSKVLVFVANNSDVASAFYFDDILGHLITCSGLLPYHGGASHSTGTSDTEYVSINIGNFPGPSGILVHNSGGTSTRPILSDVSWSALVQ